MEACDILGNKLDTGDFILFSMAQEGDFKVAEIKKITDKSIIVDSPSYWNPNSTYAMHKGYTTKRTLKIDKATFDKLKKK